MASSHLSADLSGLPDPVGATALGNVAVQAGALGALSGDLECLRATLRASVDLRTYQPTRAQAHAGEGQP